VPLVIVIFLLVCTLPLILVRRHRLVRRQREALDLRTDHDDAPALRRQREELDPWMDHHDAPALLLGWAVGLLSAERVEWGHAMLGELDRIEGRSQRRRFALGCTAGLVLLPPWGPVGPMAALGAVALSSAVVLGLGFAHFGLASNLRTG
jgi:hypothetical protein